jgi:hypothetical protein
MPKQSKALLTAKVEIKVVASKLRPEVDKAIERSRGPKQVGQAKSSKVILLGNIDREELMRRLDLAKKVLETGKFPGAAKKKLTRRVSPKKVVAKYKIVGKKTKPVKN